MGWNAPADKALNDVITPTIWNNLLGTSGSLAMALRKIAESTTPTSTTSTSEVDLVTISGLSIPVTSTILIIWNTRKTATNANITSYGLKINSTVVYAAQQILGGGSSTNQAEDGWAFCLILPRTANYLNGVMALGQSRKSSDGAAAIAAAFTGAMGAPVPNATITSIAIRALNNTNNNNAEVSSVKVYELP